MTESTGSFGAALTRSLVAKGCRVIEVNQPHPHLRSRRGHNDTIDAEAAARKVLSGEATAAATDTTGIVEAIRQLSVTRNSAVKARAAALCQIGDLLVAAGHNIDRLGSEASFAHLCATAPVPASSGRTQRHRLNFAPNRDANRALHMIVIVRLRYCERTRSYMDRRLAQGKTKKETIRCVKRFVARELYRTLRGDLSTLTTRT